MLPIRKAYFYLVRFQIRKIWVAIIDRFPSWIFRRRVAYLYELRVGTLNLVADRAIVISDGYTFRAADRHDLARCEETIGLPLQESLRRLGAGDLCLGVFTDSETASVNWIHYGPCYVRGLGFLLDAGYSDAYVYGVVTATRHREKGLYKNAQRELIRFALAAGATRAIQIVMHGNLPVLATLPKLGYELCATLRHVAFLGIKKCVVHDSRGHLVSRQWSCGVPKGVFWV